MLKFFWVLILFFCASNSGFGQGTAFNLGYQYIGKHAGFLGADARFNSTHSSAFNIGGGVYLTGLNQKFIVIPEVHVNHSLNHVFLYELSVTPKNIRPSVGLNLLNLIQLKFGYSYPLKDQQEFRAYSFGINFYLGENRFYDYLNLGF
jgi:hypothetical protein